MVAGLLLEIFVGKNSPFTTASMTTASSTAPSGVEYSCTP